MLPISHTRAGIPDMVGIPISHSRWQPGLTNVIVGQPLQETRLVTTGRGLDAGCQGAEVSLADVEQEVGS